mmetsp:Transcript_6487/g.10086  ORF Transcript_6487/g.10086 Transcript_6487/m.10086 type:complete len:197 (+) Transcript_6487:36-626(+)
MEGKAIYFEKQSRQRCGIHALNNLFQGSVFSKKSFDRICYKLSPKAFINPHKSMFGTGNYDINVLIVAVEQQGYKITWFNSQKGIDAVAFDDLLGVIVNGQPVASGLFQGIAAKVFNSQHWFALRPFLVSDSNNSKKSSMTWYSLDSNLSQPIPLPDVRTFLRNLLSLGTTHIMLVARPGVDVYLNETKQITEVES